MKKKLKWLLLLPFLLLIYLTAGTLIAYDRQPELTEQRKAELREYLSQTETGSGERARIIGDNADALLERIRLIEHAEEEIILSTFDFHSDRSGKLIIASLLRAADRGVSVKILMDGYNAVLRMEGNPYFYALSSHENAEIKIYNYVNPFTPWKSMGRMHDKYLIADGSSYLLGGRNIYDFFLGEYGEYKNYDWDVLVRCENPDDKSSVTRLKAYFESVWNYRECRLFHDQPSLSKRSRVRKAREELLAGFADYRAAYSREIDSPGTEDNTWTADRILLLSNPIVYQAKEPVLWYQLYQLMNGAKDSVVIHTPYVICNEMMFRDLSSIAANADQVKLMTNSVSNNGNPFGAAGYKRDKEELLAIGIELWEYEGGFSYHGKSILIDDHISIVGSFNMDMRSTYLDTELMLVIDSRELNRQFSEEMLSYEKSARKANPDGTYDNPYQVTPVEMTGKKRFLLGIMEIVIKWLWFLF